MNKRGANLELTKEEKYKIYLGEKEKNEQKEKQRLQEITDEQKQQIYNEYKEKEVVYVSDKDVLYPNVSLKVFSIIFGIVVAFIALFNFLLGLLVMIGAFFGFVALYFYNYKSFLLFPEIQYKCPICNSEHHNRTRIEEQREMEATGYVKAVCKKCGAKFNLVVEANVFQILDVENNKKV